ncbi:hypothetical protein PHET_07817 [Paragonimus heterotremus]|uniref:Uncharacterized protein n=1 Tax=Paragonimus heterotremus TaxID=100268 RepID=A0A8J4WFG4_9TREM|nr:hypothetical protein PHET_07817 [Paragonimus heterotremus]
MKIERYLWSSVLFIERIRTIDRIFEIYAIICSLTRRHVDSQEAFILNANLSANWKIMYNIPSDDRTLTGAHVFRG